MSGLEDQTGTIEVGKRADLVLLDRDIRRTEYAGDARVLLTLAGGAELSARQPSLEAPR